MNTPIPWIGGKSRISKKLINLFPMPFNYYVEVFGGSGAVLFVKPKSKIEVYNDLDGNLVNFWRVIKDNHEEFIDSFKYEIISREVFDNYKEKYLNNNYKDDIERAHIFYYLVKVGFGSKMDSPYFGVSLKRGGLINLKDLDNTIEQSHKRIREVIIENDSYENILKRYDREKSFFFLDPPYRDTNCYKSYNFKDDDYIKLSKLCSKLKGKFMITINDDDFIREVFKDFNIYDNSVMYSLSSKDPSYFKELVITNYSFACISK